jgi:uncharacterized protein YgbK (DUF1537 family)
VNKLLLSYYGDDFTGSTDALEQLTLAGIRAVLFIEPPTPGQLSRFKNLQAVGVAGKTRSLPPDAMERELGPALRKLKALGARHVHYKVCSTFDSSPEIGNIGRAIDVAARIFPNRFVPLVVGAPALGRYCVFGNLFARFGIGSHGAIHRLDRHPSVSRHPITPMRESDLRIHLSAQTRKRIGLLDLLQLGLPAKDTRAALERIVADGADVVLFDVLSDEQLPRIGELIDGQARRGKPLFSVGSSGIEMALGAFWNRNRNSNVGADVRRLITGSRSLRLVTSSPTDQLLVGSGSCSPVTSGQIHWALANGFAEVALDPLTMAHERDGGGEMARAISLTVKHLGAGRSVIVHTTRSGSDRLPAMKLKGKSAEVLGTVIGKIMRDAIAQSSVQRLCIAGGDTSSFAARAMGIEALEMIAALTPGAPLCKAFAPGSPIDGREIVFKGGQVGGETYFGIVRKGKA